MLSLRPAAAGLALAAMSLVVTGCGVDPGSDDKAVPQQVTPAPTQLGPAEKLADAAAKTNKGVVTVVMQASGIRTELSMDPADRKAKLSIALVDEAGDTLRAEAIQLGTDLYVRTSDVPGVAKGWMRSSVTDLPAGSSFNLLPDSDHTGAADLANCVVNAKRKGGSDFVGTLDLTRSHFISKRVVAGLGAKAKAVPFSVLASPSGDLFEFHIDIPSVLPTHGAIKYAYSRSDGVDAAAPAGSRATELPRSVLDLFQI
ncbi:hypothetical protein I0C86_42085 [Plantactinospora sp. S1510]|uniref:Lipoprotein n=1 Tax=Plantactinospora alkalitolerans TaxID=2789879 RepID=A0ABS0HAF6_9ACTN|nr:hypothetical protein [Plantactinospora alkalitolerans]MBF9135445.1 hypothetical protein [Plantactinospora alkalitolerans]